VRNDDKPAVVDLARRLRTLGFKLITTGSARSRSLEFGMPGWTDLS
jgi:hypothetical protein